jgi:phosphoglycolate phosphatase-like HAD superfamily hydrolase
MAPQRGHESNRYTRRFNLCLFAASWLIAIGCRASRADTDPLPSWNDGSSKKAIVDFVRATTDKGSSEFVAPEERIVTLDNDGTLWVEQPMYTQGMFAIDRVMALAPKHPEWKTEQPFQAILKHDREAMEKFTIQDYEKIVAVTHSGMSTDDFLGLAKEWLATAKHPRFKRPYTDLVYQPMIELMKYLRANGFKTYIVTGGGQEFVRAFSTRVYGVPVEQVMGTATKVKYQYGPDRKPVLVKLPDVLILDDKTGKPEGINLVVGRKPNAAFGNSSGDQQMLEYTQAGEGARLVVLVHHDDATREYAYGPESKVGTFPDALMNEAKQRGWTVISMKNDWKRIFSFAH